MGRLTRRRPAAGPRLPTAGELRLAAHLLWRLPAFLRGAPTTEEARQTLARRLGRREAAFLALAERAVYANPGSPYRRLLAWAGCERPDLERLERLVRTEGLEGALEALCRQGVYLSVDELKGRRPVVRGSASFRVDPLGLWNPATPGHVVAQTSGSRGERTIVPLDLAVLRDWAVNLRLDLTARGGADWVHGRWSVPGGDAVAFLLTFAAAGWPARRWFSQVDPGAPGLHPRYRWSGRLIRWGSRVAGVPLPRPEHVPVGAPEPIVRWMAGVLRTGRTPCLVTYVSSAVRVCQAAAETGVDLAGARFSLLGEPLTSARLGAIRRAGAAMRLTYGTVETGVLGTGCLMPSDPDDVHLHHDTHAVIEVGADGPAALPSDALLVSSLLPAAPLVLLNVSTGDRAALSGRRCGCPLEALGWTRHLAQIRSFEKLTAGGMTFADTDVIAVLEEALPARFGGGPTDYQLAEDETADGRPRLSLLVDPRVGRVDPGAVVEAFLQALGEGSGAPRVMTAQWRQWDLLEVVRRSPVTARSGKILHLHQHAARRTDAHAPIP